ncbi:MAG: fibronectin type III domain-containing protein [Propionibacteriales bacterium]|nr:fibronectin type III domain-containing protein [Propionibacteriales bacterium]
MSGNHEAPPRSSRRTRAALAVLGLVIVALAPMAPASAASSITLSRGSVIGGESISVTGNVGIRKARPVTLQRLSGTTWLSVTPSRSTSTGAFRFYYKPPTRTGTRTVLRVIAPRVTISGRTYARVTTGSRSVLTVGQTATVTVPSVVSQGVPFTVGGKFGPARQGREVVLQKFVNGTWVKVGASRYESSTGAVTFPVTLSTQGDLPFRVTALAENGAPAVASAPGTVAVSMPVPSGVVVTPGDSSAQVSWNPVDAAGLVGYHVYQRSDPSDLTPWTRATTNPVSSTTFNVTGLTNSVTYYFTVTSVRADGDESAFATKASATPVPPPDTTPPPVPDGVTAEPGNASAQVSWNAVVAGDLAGYNVYRGTSAAGPWTKLNGSLISGSTTYQATSLTNGTTYFFAVTSVDSTVPAANESGLSAADSTVPAPGADTTPPPVPGGLLVTPGNHSAQLSWNPVVAGDLAGYNVYQAPSASGPWSKVNGSLISGSTTYQATSLTNGTEYFFAVTSVDTNTPGANESARSATAPATPIAPPAGWTAVSTGLQHTCALGSNGTLWCWGRNTYGQLGSNADITSPTPTKVGSASTWTDVSAGDDFTCGIQAPGTLWCWGYNQYGQLGTTTNVGTNLANAVPVQVGSATSWTSVSAGRNSACGRQSDGTLWCWGLNLDGQLGRVENANSSTPNPGPGKVGSNTDWAFVTVGADQACATRSGGTLWCWGSNLSGQLGNSSATMGTFTPTTAPVQVGTAATWSKVSAGEYHTCAVQTSGIASCWGSNEYGELGVTANSVVNATPTAVPGSGWISISAGGDHTCGTKADGVYCFGRNQAGQLGTTANATANPAPTKVGSTSSSWSAADGGALSTCAVTTAGKVFCWGSNEYGQVGDPATVDATPHPTPFDVAVPAG